MLRLMLKNYLIDDAARAEDGANVGPLYLFTFRELGIVGDEEEEVMIG